MYSWIYKDGNTVKTKTIAEFVKLTGFRRSNAQSLACAHYLSLNGWCSGHRRAARKRKRWSTVLINTRTNGRCVLGPSVASFALKHNICKGDLYKLINHRKPCVKGWMLESTLELTQGAVADEHFPKSPNNSQNQGTKPPPTLRNAVLVDSTALPAT